MQMSTDLYGIRVLAVDPEKQADPFACVRRLLRYGRGFPLSFARRRQASFCVLYGTKSGDGLCGEISSEQISTSLSLMPIPTLRGTIRTAGNAELPV